ncbi:hypothetical protein [Paenibacillus hamazuiensis]|uniref:hypothetical protein n=1 Tax=Paenibacillus hamazuiensis TaxID=2936508 RepID=UPI002010B403|nr:hypothetical protein [Paenibacillus hamazuiensis]
MAVFSPARTFGISIERDPEEVYAFVYDGANLPSWVKDCTDVIKAGHGWTMKTANGSLDIRFVEKNALGVLDYYVVPAPGMEIYFPMRAFPNGTGSEVILTMFRLPFMSDEQFAAGAEIIEYDLESLKKVLEASR